MNKQMAGGWAILVLGIAILLFGFFITYKVRKYEFENRTGGGAVGFKDYGQSVLHRIKKGSFGSLMTIGVLMVLAGLVMVASAG